MSLPATIAPAILQIAIARLAALFLTVPTATSRPRATPPPRCSPPTTPRHPKINQSLRRHIGLHLHAREVLSYAATPDLSLNKILRLQGSAVSLSREFHKAQRKLDQLQNARRTGLAAPAGSPVPLFPIQDRDDALGLIEAARDVIQTTGKTGGKRPGHRRCKSA